MAYFPYISPHSARHKLMSLISTAGTLLAELRATGYTDKQKEFSPHQLQLIFDGIGNPFS